MLVEVRRGSTAEALEYRRRHTFKEGSEGGVRCVKKWRMGSPKRLHAVLKRFSDKLARKNQSPSPRVFVQNCIVSTEKKLFPEAATSTAVAQPIGQGAT